MNQIYQFHINIDKEYWFFLNKIPLNQSMNSKLIHNMFDQNEFYESCKRVKNEKGLSEFDNPSFQI